ncbi:uncharacterized protein LOC144712800 isoform X2 [Wolffia australiana]
MSFLRLLGSNPPPTSLPSSSNSRRSSISSLSRFLPPRGTPRLLNYRLRRPSVSLGKGQEDVSEKELVENVLRDGAELRFESADLGRDGETFKKTLRLVECAMFASVSALAYLLGNSLAIENYIGSFFALPIVISSMRWGLAAGRKTMIATAVLLLTLAGPVKASTYLLLHGFLGLAMGSLWRMQTSWGLSIAICSLVRALGAVGFVLISSFLIRENILALI